VKKSDEVSLWKEYRLAVLARRKKGNYQEGFKYEIMRAHYLGTDASEMTPDFMRQTWVTFTITTINVPPEQLPAGYLPYYIHIEDI